MDTNPMLKAFHFQLLSLPEDLVGAVVPDWVQVLPAGRFAGRDGRGPYSCDARAVCAATLAHFGEAEIPLDYDHQLELSAENGQPAPASGWVKELEPRADGLWARVEWTAKARAGISAREYRYLSPVFFHDKAGTIRRLDSIALTNLPNLPLKALSRKGEAGANFKPKEEPMGFNTLMRAIFGLPESATDDQIATHAKHLTAETSLAKSAQAKAENELAEVRKALAVKDGDDLTKAAMTARSQADAPDPARFVPVGVLQSTAAELAELKAMAAKESAAALVDEGVRAGKISPAMSDWAKDYAAKDPEGFKAFMAKAPSIQAGGSAAGDKGPGATPPKDDEGELSKEEKAVCRATGISEDDYKKARAAQAEDGK